MHQGIGILLSATTLVAVVACSSAPSSSSPQPGPTSSSLSSTTSAAPTAVTAASTAVAGAAAAGSTAVAAAPVQIASANVSPADATVTLLNSGSQPLSLSGWTLMVGSTPISLPSSATIPANQRLTLHSANGADSGTDVYLGGKVPNLTSMLQPGTRVALENPSGAPVTAFTVPNA